MPKTLPSTDSGSPTVFATTSLVETPLPWLAVRVRTGREQHVSSLLEAKGLDVFLPTYRRRHFGRRRPALSDRQALFPGYLFCRVDPNDRLPVLSTTWVDYILGGDRGPIPVPDSEVRSLRLLLEQSEDAQEESYSVGQIVRLMEGPLAGVEGVVRRLKDRCRIVVGIPLLQRAVAAEVDCSSVLPLSTNN